MSDPSTPAALSAEERAIRIMAGTNPTGGIAPDSITAEIRSAETAAVAPLQERIQKLEGALRGVLERHERWHADGSHGGFGHINSIITDIRRALLNGETP